MEQPRHAPSAQAMISSQAAWPEFLLCSKGLYRLHHRIGAACINECLSGSFIDLVKQYTDTAPNTDGSIIRSNMHLDPIVFKFLHRIHMRPIAAHQKSNTRCVLFCFLKRQIKSSIGATCRSPPAIITTCLVPSGGIMKWGA